MLGLTRDSRQIGVREKARQPVLRRLVGRRQTKNSIRRRLRAHRSEKLPFAVDRYGSSRGSSDCKTEPGIRRERYRRFGSGMKDAKAAALPRATRYPARPLVLDEELLQVGHNKMRFTRPLGAGDTRSAVSRCLLLGNGSARKSKC